MVYPCCPSFSLSHFYSVDPNEGFHWLYFSSHTLGLLAYSFMLYILHLFVISNRWTVSAVSADDTILEVVHEQSCW
jgi:hypothetical protein